MRRALLILFVAISAVVAFVIARGTSGGTNIDKRQKHWERQISEGLKAGASREELEAFAKARGQTLSCYTNYKKEDQCDFEDGESLGGSRNMPLRLAVIFVLKDNKVASHQFGTASANKPAQ